MVPLVLHHGLFGFDEVRLGKLRLRYFHGIGDALEARGNVVIVPRVAPAGSIEKRARQLKDCLEQRMNDLHCDQVFIIAHSMGGLDARYMITRLGMADRVAGLLTLSTPHRGSPYADWCVRNLGRRLRGLQLMKMLHLDVQGILDLTCASCQRFNETTPDAPGVRYYSVSATRPWELLPPFAFHSARVIEEAQGPNDGLVSVSSAAWGTHLATWPVDHWRLINRVTPCLKPTTNDITSYYLNVLDTIAATGPQGDGA